jgi:hypothetical protein
MMKSSLGLATAGVLFVAGQGWAQTPPSAPASPQAPASGAVSDAEVQSFARVTLKLHALTQPTPEQMGEVITGAGFTVEQYNALAARMQKDQAFQGRVNAELVHEQQMAQGAGSPPLAPPPPPPLPTSGPGASVVTVLSNVCLPMLRQNQPVSEAGPRAGLRLDKKSGSYVGAFGGAPYSITVLPRGANQKVCDVELRSPPDAGNDIAKALNIWTMHQDPAMKMVRNDVAVGADGLKRITLSWEQAASGRSAGLVFVRVEQPDGAPLETGIGTAKLLYSEQGG